MKTFICYLFFFFFPPFFLLCSVCYCPWCSFTCFKDLSSWERSSTPTNPLCSAEEVAHFWRGKQRSYQQVHLILYYFAETHCIPSCFGRWGGGGGGGSFSCLYEKIQRTHFHTHPFFMATQFYPMEPQDLCESILKAQQHIANRKWKGRTSFFTLV